VEGLGGAHEEVSVTQGDAAFARALAGEGMAGEHFEGVPSAQRKHGAVLVVAIEFAVGSRQGTPDRPVARNLARPEFLAIGWIQFADDAFLPVEDEELTVQGVLQSVGASLKSQARWVVVTSPWPPGLNATTG